METPPEIIALRQRLAELEAMAASRGFNEAVRRAAGLAPPEAEPETPPAEPETPATPTRGVQAGPVRREGFNETLRRLRGFTE